MYNSAFCFYCQEILLQINAGMSFQTIFRSLFPEFLLPFVLSQLKDNLLPLSPILI